MPSLLDPRQQTLERFVAANGEAGRLHDWTGLADFYAKDPPLRV